jgi:hypothetical protein
LFDQGCLGYPRVGFDNLRKECLIHVQRHTDGMHKNVLFMHIASVKLTTGWSNRMDEAYTKRGSLARRDECPRLASDEADHKHPRTHGDDEGDRTHRR